MSEDMGSVHQDLKGLCIERIVRYVLPGGKIRPAIVLGVHGTQNGCVNLAVFLDGVNDGATFDHGPQPHPMLEWATSRVYDPNKTPGTWHWPPKS